MTNSISDNLSPVASEIQSGDGLSLTMTAKMFPGHRGQGTINPSTVFRWIKKGLTLAPGVVIRLEGCRAGARWLTSRAAVGRFIAACTSVAESAASTTPQLLTTPSAQKIAAETAGRDLENAGY
jgi:hypothetical protein